MTPAPTPLRVLLAEDDPADARLILHELARAGYRPEGATVDNEEAFAAAVEARPDVILCDWNMPAFGALRAIEVVTDRCPEIPLIIVSGSIGEEAAVRAIKLGATDYLLKDRLARLGRAVRQALEQRELRAAERRAREELRASEARYRALADGIPEIVWTARANGAIVYFNRRIAEYTGLATDDLMGWQWERVVHPNDFPRLHDTWEAILRTAVPQDCEFRIRRADGQYRWHIGRQVAARGPGGELVQWIGTCADIHDQKAAAEALARDAQILAGVRDSVIVTDPDGVVTYWNEGATRLFGWTADEMVGQPYADRFREPYRSEIRRALGERLSGTEWNGEYEDHRKDGSRVWINARVRRFDRADGTPVGVLGLSYDISDRKRLEAQFQQAQKMEAVGRLAGGVAHDFNNLLTVINLHADLALPKTAQSHPAWEALTAVRDAGERAAALTGQLLAFSRKAIITPQVVDLNEAITHAERLLRRLIGEDILLTAVLAPVPCRIKIDPNQLDQVILNLAVNARDAMPTGGRLTIETRRVELAPGALPSSGEFVSGPHVELVISDTGGGMTDEVKAKLFEPFFTTKGPGKGTGLGLAVVHGVVKQAGGHVAVESTVGSGAAFHIYLPEVPMPAPASAVVAAAAPGPGSEAVLLVEDDDAVRRVCRIALESQGYNVVPADCAATALAAIDRQASPIRLLVTDVVMPGMSGRELADAARGRIPGLRVLYVSGYTDDAVVRHGVRESTDAFLRKPFSPLGLARKVREMMDGRG